MRLPIFASSLGPPRAPTLICSPSASLHCTEGTAPCPASAPAQLPPPAQISLEKNLPVRAPARPGAGEWCLRAQRRARGDRQWTGSSTARFLAAAGSPHPGALQWGELPVASTHLPSARGQAHAWPGLKFSTADSGPASPELASHHLSELAWVCLCSPFLERCGPVLRCPLPAPGGLAAGASHSTLHFKTGR